MFNLEKFIADSVTFRPRSMFEADIEANRETLTREKADEEFYVPGEKIDLARGGSLKGQP